MRSIVFTMNQYPDNTYIIDFTMNSNVFIQKATASAADLSYLRPGCLDAWMLGCLSNQLFGIPVSAGALILKAKVGGVWLQTLWLRF